MGIKREGDWWKIVQRNREEEEKRVKAGMTPRFHAEKFDPPGKLITTPQVDRKFVDMVPRDEHGNIKVHTERGKRRRAKRGK